VCVRVSVRVCVRACVSCMRTWRIVRVGEIVRHGATVLLLDVMGDGGLEGKVRFAWQQYLAVQRLAEFDEMFPVYGRMAPVVVALFDTDCTHWGAPYPMPGTEYPQHYQLIHYRGHIYFIDTRVPNPNANGRVNFLAKTTKPQSSTTDGLRDLEALRPLLMRLKERTSH